MVYLFHCQNWVWALPNWIMDCFRREYRMLAPNSFSFYQLTTLWIWLYYLFMRMRQKHSFWLILLNLLIELMWLISEIQCICLECWDSLKAMKAGFSFVELFHCYLSFDFVIRNSSIHFIRLVCYAINFCFLTFFQILLKFLAELNGRFMIITRMIWTHFS
jgi:hypothetical protein